VDATADDTVVGAAAVVLGRPAAVVVGIAEVAVVDVAGAIVGAVTGVAGEPPHPATRSSRGTAPQAIRRFLTSS
jgi:hypothetical protein